MSRTVGIAPGFLNKLDEIQRAFLITSTGRAFYDEFLCAHGKHTYLFGTTGSGKTNKGYWLVDFLKHKETQVWISSGKIGETLPLLCMGKSVRVIVPTGCDVVFEIYGGNGWEKIENHPKVIQVPTPEAMLHAIKSGKEIREWDPPGTINILEIRNAFYDRREAVAWNAELFNALSYACRYEGELPKWLFPMCWHIDESQWTIAGSRVANEAERNRAAEIISENAMELRSAGVRLILYAQDYKNILPTARENMLFHILCRGADVTMEENRKLGEWCRYAPQRRPPSPQYFQTEHGRFVFESDHRGWGDSYPPETPWTFRKYPLDAKDREWCERVRVRYVGRHDQTAETEEVMYPQPFPQLGKLSAITMPEEKQESQSHYSRYMVPEGME